MTEQGIGLHWSSLNLHILAGFIRQFIFRREKPFTDELILNFGDILPETSKSSAFWDMGVDSQLKWLLLFSPNEAGELGLNQSMGTHALMIHIKLV